MVDNGKIGLFIFALVLVASLSFTGWAQDGGHEHPSLEQTDIALSAEIDALARELTAEIEAVRDETRALQSRVEALENQEPTDPPVEPPVEPALPVPVYISTDGETLTPITSETLTTDGPFNICLLSADTDGPVFFRWDGNEHREGQGAFCLFGGNDNPYPLESLPAGTHEIEIEAPGVEPFTITIVVEDNAPVPPTGEGRALLQTSGWTPMPANIAQIYIDVIRASETVWSGDPEIDPVTGLPSRLAGGATQTDVYFTAPRSAPELMAAWDGDWVLEFQTADGNCSATLQLVYFPGDPQNANGSCRIEFTRDFAGGVTPYHMAVRVRTLSSPLTELHMFRAEHEASHRAGKIYNPDYVAMLSGYDIFRNMDTTEANRANIRSVDQLATMRAAHWSNIEWQYRGTRAQPFYGQPLAAAFALGVEADIALWLHGPITLGAPKGAFDPDIYDADAALWLDNVRDMALDHREAILASPEWDRYADAFVAALIDSGYPETRPLYVTLANEVWNRAALYIYTVRYAMGLGGGHNLERVGYGRAMARYKLALDGALKRAGREQNIVYVIEGQAGNRATTRLALDAARGFMLRHGEAWEDHAPGFGVSVASYWGAYGVHLIRDGVDPNDSPALENWLVNGPANSISNLNWNLAQWRAHADEAATFGVAFIGAYEGGSHLERDIGMTVENHRAFVWGGDGVGATSPGARVNTAVNEALADAFPGAILSNYVLCGPTGGQPWFEPCDGTGPMNEGWKRLGEALND